MVNLFTLDCGWEGFLRGLSSSVLYLVSGVVASTDPLGKMVSELSKNTGFLEFLLGLSLRVTLSLSSLRRL